MLGRVYARFSEVIRVIWKWTARISGILAFIIFLLGGLVLLFPDSILRWTAETWSVAVPPEKSDAIFVLGGGNAFRPQAAAILWKNDYARKIMVFRAEDPMGESQSKIIANETVEILAANGVPEEDILVLDTTVSSTYDEAVATARTVDEKRFSKILIPTHIFHSRRTRRIFSKLVNCEVVVTEADYIHFRSDGWWKNEWGVIQFPNEVLKDIFYRIRY